VNVVIFTGAGAGKADGAPLQTELFQEFFSRATIPEARSRLKSDVTSFFETTFGIDLHGNSGPTFPTFEESLGVIELALIREESILGVSAQHESQLQQLKRQLILALAVTIARSPASGPTHHSKLVASLRDEKLLNGTIFVTTNYDTLLDDGIELKALSGARGTGSLVDYGFAGLVQRDSGEYTEERTFKCYKVHGSLNWLYCTACDDLHITYASDGVTRLVDEPDAALCPTCDTPRTPVIIPPSYYKQMSNMYLAVVWNQAFRALRDADRIVFCGYSFSDADMHVKYLVKRAQLNRNREVRPLDVMLVNHHPGKPPDTVNEEYRRFSRFLGGANLEDTGLSFEQFAANPRSVLERRA
jgi:NAD-dependent SIR2 family protein deacetylase